MGRKFLYLLVTEDRKLMKVGFTWNIRLRMRQLKRERRRRLRLVAFITMSDKWEAFAAETAWHRHVTGGVKRREWHKFEGSHISRFLQQDGVVICN
jgi:hypothetical protein